MTFMKREMKLPANSSLESRGVVPGHGDALVLVDVQRDFLTDGALSVPGAEAVIEALNRHLVLFAGRQLPVFVIRDWHPANHYSFREFGGRWPTHCVAGTWGAELAPSLHLPEQAHLLSKGRFPEAEGESGFEGTRLAELLQQHRCRRMFIGGLATDHCVRATALDGLRNGFQVVVLEDAIRPLNLRPDDGAHALAELTRHGAHLARMGTAARVMKQRQPPAA